MGRDLVGLAYEPLFDYFVDRVSEQSYHVIASSHVTTGDGTGLVHMAPDFGEDDFLACKAQGIGVLQSVDDEGNFVSDVRDFAGQNIKEADPEFLRNIKERGRLFKQSTIQHSYPYCWRSGTPLIIKHCRHGLFALKKYEKKWSKTTKTFIGSQRLLGTNVLETGCQMHAIGTSRRNRFGEHPYRFGSVVVVDNSPVLALSLIWNNE